MLLSGNAGILPADGRRNAGHPNGGQDARGPGTACNVFLPYENKTMLLLSAAYLLSGLCALIYETIWIYKFSRIFGSTVLAMSCVVAIFFTGLAFGSRLFGKISERSKNPLRMYACLELALGAYALAFSMLLSLAEKLYAAFYPELASSFALLTLARMALACVLLLPPTILMGGTLPVLLVYFTSRLDALGRRAGWLYGLNALGAALGSFLTGYALLELLGVAWTNAAAAFVNLAIGLLAWAMAHWKLGIGDLSSKATPVHDTLAADAASVAQNSPRLALAVFAVSGFVCMSYEVLWLRYLSFYFHETVCLYSGIIAIFVLGIGLGSLICGFLVSKIRCALAWLGVLQAGIGLLTMLAVYLPIGRLDAIYDAGVRSGFNVLWILAALLLLPAILMGATFPLAAQSIVADLREVGGQVGRACSLNTLGCVLGLLCSGFVLQKVFGMQMTLYILLCANLILAAALIAADERLGRPYLGFAPLVLGAGAVCFIQFSDLALPQAILRQRQGPDEEILEVREGLQGLAWATRHEDGAEVQLWQNGTRISRGGRSTFLAQGYIPMLLAPAIPRDVLGLAFGGGLSYRGPRLFPEVRHFDFVDISKDTIAIALKFLPENEGLKDDPRARFIWEDAYSYVKYVPAKYDLILMEPTPPRFSYQTSALYTREFYELVRQRLKDRGCFAQVLPLNDLSPGETRSVMLTFSAVFAHCLLWRNGWDCLMLGRQDEFKFDLAVIKARLERPEIQKSLRECAPLPDRYYILANFISGLLLHDSDFRRAAASGPAVIYTDDNPGLRFSSGRDITTGNIRFIHACLSPWSALSRLFKDSGLIASQAEALTGNREYFMARLFQHKPREFPEIFKHYIASYSKRKKADTESLRDYLLEHGLADEAERLPAN
jgi:spermidine synthase